MIEIKDDLDPILETLGLLYTARHVEALEKEGINALDELGGDGEKIYQNEFVVYRRYVDVFVENKKTNEYDDFFFGENDADFVAMIVTVLIEKQYLFSSFADITSDEINKEIILSYAERYEEEINIDEISNYEDILGFLMRSKLTDGVKWKLANLMRDSKKYYQGLVNLVDDNIIAFEKARDYVEEELRDYLAVFRASMKKERHKQYFDLIKGFPMIKSISPTLVFPVTQMVYKEYSYYGLLNESVLQIGNDKESEKEALLMKFKALGDSSKFEILLSLKDSPKYNLEMAEKLGLSASTMSHHMNALLVCGLVGVTKKSGKVYYHIEKNGLEKLKEGINYFFIS